MLAELLNFMHMVCKVKLSDFWALLKHWGYTKDYTIDYS